MEKISIFDNDRLRNLFSGSLYPLGQPFPQENLQPNSLTETASVGTVRDNSDNPSQCLTCGLNLTSREDQLEHYKSDWHRYNLKLKLNGRCAVSQSEFEDVINEVSSISGSDSENECVSHTVNEDAGKLNKAISAVTIVETNNESSLPAVAENLRTPKIYLKNYSDMILSFYQCVLPESNNESEDINISNLQASLLKPVKCLIILFSAGHFAACVFEGENPLVHKTFHRYVLRAKQGTVQSVRDNQGNAPKSGGAALRRHNEAALAADIQSLMNSWKMEYINDCSHIFLRTPQYGKSVFFNGKTAAFDRKDIRIKGIPFPTRRPTFSELKRVHRELFSISIENAPTNIPKEKEVSNNNAMPEIINAVENVTVHSADGKTDDVSVGTVPKSSKKRRHKRKNSGNAEPASVTLDREVEIEHSHDPIVDELFTVCKMGNLVGLKAILADLIQSQATKNICCDTDAIRIRLNEPVTMDNDTLLHVASKSGHPHIIQCLLEHGADPANKNIHKLVPFQVASDKPTRNTFRKFMAQYPMKFNYKVAQVPGPLTEDMEYERKQKLLEKKKAQKAVKKEKMKEQKAIEAKIDAERLEQERFATLSDREKRAIAAERRFAKQLLSQGTGTPSSAVRCWLCGTSLLGKIPFEYFDYQFCSINCLKTHKSSVNINK